MALLKRHCSQPETFVSSSADARQQKSIKPMGYLYKGSLGLLFLKVI